MIKAVIFDLDGTITNEDQINFSLVQTFKKNKKIFGNITLDIFIKANNDAFNHFYKLYKSKKILLSQLSYLIWFETLARLDIPEKPRTVYKLYETLQSYIVKKTCLNEYVLETLSYLKKNGYKIGVLSNGLFLERVKKIKKVKIENLIDILITTDMIGKDKPNAKPFQHILKILKIKPYEAIYVGNSLEEDIRGAQKSGIKTVLYPESPNSTYADYCINSFKKLILILKQLEQ